MSKEKTTGVADNKETVVFAQEEITEGVRQGRLVKTDQIALSECSTVKCGSWPTCMRHEPLRR